MSELKSKVAYLQGLSSGLNLDTQSNEGRLLHGIIDVLDEFANSVGELEQNHEELEDYLESIDEDLYALENEFYGGEDEDYVEVECPQCGETVCFDSGILEDDESVEVVCPNCDEVVFVNDDNLEVVDEPELLEDSPQVEEDI